ncbi:hypothetical protein Tsubulata_027278 [Turnera subulata]|uniref:NB-ARC domain-containing protein n=1 Tax=Turnera subulata TaxID=218843 RepID=A0A9Q0FUY0_9ROSI|nr:hypothetical protein Tsubulata_027278 [Turnera subulata]
MGGSGKTTLIAKTYNCEIVKRHFECSAWITVSQTYSIEDLFKSFIRQFYEAANETIPLDLATMSYRELVETLVNYLERKRYIVVLDDVWDTELWNKIKVALLNSWHGCRVIITTRMDDVAAKSFEVGSNVHHIKAMEENEAWTLFCVKAFPWNARRCPQELEDLAKDVVEKCQGLPLAVVSSGGLFSTKRSELEWKTTYNSLNLELNNNNMLKPIKSILLLSYNDLPYRMKHCFLHCCTVDGRGIYREYQGIDTRRIADRYLPNGIVNLKNLQYLVSNQLKDEAYDDFNRMIGTRFPPKMNTLNNLQVFGYVEANSIVVKEIRSLTQLVILEIVNIEGSDEEDLCLEIQNMRLLRRLYVKAAKKDGILCLDALKSPPPFLEFLVLNLRHLGLNWSRLTNDPLSHLEALRNLRCLYLGKAYEELHLEFKNAFGSLEILGIFDCQNLHSITIDKGVMPGHKELVIRSCRMMKEVATGIKYLTKLQELRGTIEPSGVDRPNVQHIPKITYYYKTSKGWSIRNLSSFQTHKGRRALVEATRTLRKVPCLL